MADRGRIRARNNPCFPDTLRPGETRNAKFAAVGGTVYLAVASRIIDAAGTFGRSNIATFPRREV
jgi:hypothetical protein